MIEYCLVCSLCDWQYHVPNELFQNICSIWIPYWMGMWLAYPLRDNSPNFSWGAVGPISQKQVTERFKSLLKQSEFGKVYSDLLGCIWHIINTSDLKLFNWNII